MSTITPTITINCLLNLSSKKSLYAEEFLKHTFSTFCFKKPDGTFVEIKADWLISTSKSLNGPRFHIIVNSQLKKEKKKASTDELSNSKVRLFIRTAIKEVTTAQENTKDQNWPNGQSTFFIGYKLNDFKVSLENQQPLSEKSIQLGKYGKKGLQKVVQRILKQQQPEIYKTLQFDIDQEEATLVLKQTSAIKPKSLWETFVNTLFERSISKPIHCEKTVWSRFREVLFAINAVAITTILCLAYINRSK